MATSIDDNAADGIIGKYKVGVFKNDYTNIVRFLVASKVAKYNAFSRECDLVNTLRWRFSRRYDALSGSIALVV